MSLPKTAQDIVDIIGMTAAMGLVSGWPGIPLKVPRGRRKNSVMVNRLARVIGDEAAKKFVQHYAGHVVVIPRCAAAMRAVRNQRIIDQYTHGTTAADLAREHKLTVRQIRVILNTPYSADVSQETKAAVYQLTMDF